MTSRQLKQIRRACEDDAWVYLKHYVYTYDNQGAQPVKRFPQYDYLRDYIHRIRFEGGMPVNSVILVPKSRRTLASWSTMADCTHLAFWRPHSLILVQSQKEEKAKDLVSGRCGFICDHVPTWLRPCDYDTRRLEIKFGNGSHIVGVPQGRDQVVQYGPTRYVQDEVTIQDDGEAAYSAIAPALQDGGQYIGLGTPRGQSEPTAKWFWEFCGKIHGTWPDLDWEGKEDGT